MNNFSQRLRSLRGKRSQKEFAEFLGFNSQQTYANYERGRIPKPETLQMIAQQTGVTVDWLLNGEGESDGIIREENLSLANQESSRSETDHFRSLLVEVISTMPTEEVLSQILDLMKKQRHDEAQILIDMLRGRERKGP
jgi:transcriptional regulator with XRE-family HTH domain